MTNWNRIKEIERINEHELRRNVPDSASWHYRYHQSAYIYVGNLNFDLTEGDLIAVFSQFGEVVDCNLIRDKETGQPKGFAFIAFEDQKSTVLAVDNMNGAVLLQRTLNVDHVLRYRKPKHFKEREKNNNNNGNGNEYGDIDEDDQTYEERRRKIWDYQKYYSDLQAETHAMDQAAIDAANDKYLQHKNAQQVAFKHTQSALDEQIEMRKLKRELLRAKRSTERRRKEDARTTDAHVQAQEWTDYGHELREKSGKVVDIAAELEKRKHIQTMQRKAQYAREMNELKQEKQRKKRAKLSKSELLSKKLKKLNKNMKKKRHREFQSDDR